MAKQKKEDEYINLEETDWYKETKATMTPEKYDRIYRENETMKKTIQLPITVRCQDCRGELPTKITFEDGEIFIDLDLDDKKVKDHDCDDF